jgi:hypothetical protein
MKRCLVLRVALLSIAFAGAAHALPRPHFGLEFAPQLTQFAPRSNDVGFDVKDHYRMSAEGGVRVEWPVRLGLVLVSGLHYGEHADRQDVTASFFFNGTPVGDVTSTQDVRLRQLSVPVRLEWRVMRWRVGLGPETRYLLRADNRWVVPGTAVPASSPLRIVRRPGPAVAIFEEASQHGWTDVTDAFRRWSVGLQFGVGHDFPVAGHHVHVDARWHEGLTRQQWSSDFSQRARAAQLAFGWGW